MEGDSDRRDNNRQHNQREVIFIDKNNIHKYSIYDVVLPLPGCNITYPANEVADWYKDLLLADGLLEKDFNSGLKYLFFRLIKYDFLLLLFSQLYFAYLFFIFNYVYDYSTYGINGAYRPMVLRPSNLKWKFVHYDNPDQKLIPSDLDRLHQIELPPVGSQGIFHVSLFLYPYPHSCPVFILL
jgi:tRNA pseudouridine13 synthase